MASFAGSAYSRKFRIVNVTIQGSCVDWESNGLIWNEFTNHETFPFKTILAPKVHQISYGLLG